MNLLLKNFWCPSQIFNLIIDNNDIKAVRQRSSARVDFCRRVGHVQASPTRPAEV